MSEPQFPNYPTVVSQPEQEQPVPKGIPFIDPKYHKPLYKLMKQMFKPKRTPAKIKTGRHRKKRVGF
jgi:hypothetical protein